VCDGMRMSSVDTRAAEPVGCSVQKEVLSSKHAQYSCALHFLTTIRSNDFLRLSDPTISMHNILFLGMTTHFKACASGTKNDARLPHAKSPGISSSVEGF
jgi:hypothetical protein